MRKYPRHPGDNEARKVRHPADTSRPCPLFCTSEDPGDEATGSSLCFTNTLQKPHELFARCGRRQCDRSERSRPHGTRAARRKEYHDMATLLLLTNALTPSAEVLPALGLL